MAVDPSRPVAACMQRVKPPNRQQAHTTVLFGVCVAVCRCTLRSWPQERSAPWSTSSSWPLRYSSSKQCMGRSWEPQKPCPCFSHGQRRDQQAGRFKRALFGSWSGSWLGYPARRPCAAAMLLKRNTGPISHVCAPRCQPLRFSVNLSTAMLLLPPIPHRPCPVCSTPHRSPPATSRWPST